MGTKGLTKLNRTRRWMIALVIATLLIITVLLLSRPMLLKTYLFANMFGTLSDPPLTVMNPLRDKAPENAANNFLKQLQNEEPAALLRDVIKDEPAFQHISQMEKEHRLKTWNDFTREDSAEGVELMYWPQRENYSAGFAPPILITVAKVGGELKVTSYSAGY